METPVDIIERAIREWGPSHLICLYSGGYDSACMTHLVMQHNFGLPTMVYAIDTYLSADGWRDYVDEVAHSFGWPFDIYDNLSGFGEFLEWVSKNGCPYSPAGHRYAYNKLKDRAVDAILREHKTGYYDKVLFLSGIRQDESQERSRLTEPVQRRGQSNAIFANPIFYWSGEDCLTYRIENDLPVNPFYETLGGSGDCYCNWGKWTDFSALMEHSPRLASKRVSKLHQAGYEAKGYGWDEHPRQGVLEREDEDHGFWLCQGCKRVKPGMNRAAEEAVMSRIW